MFDLMPHRRRYGKEMVSFKDEMDNLFNRFFDMDFPISRRLFKDGEWAPRVDVVEGNADSVAWWNCPRKSSRKISMRYTKKGC